MSTKKQLRINRPSITWTLSPEEIAARRPRDAYTAPCKPASACQTAATPRGTVICLISL